MAAARDPRAQLLDGPAWETVRGQVLDGLGLTEPVHTHLRSQTAVLDAAWRQMADRLAEAGDTAIVRVVPDAEGRMRLSVERLDALDIPASLVELRELTAAMLPRIDLPELLLEVHAWTGFLDAYVHASGAEARMTDLPIRLGDAGPRTLHLPVIGTLALVEETRRLRRMLDKGRAKILFATVRKTGRGRWTVSLNVEAADLHPDRQHQSPTRSWGSTGGFPHYAVAATATGAEVARLTAPKPLAGAQRRLRRANKACAAKNPAPPTAAARSHRRPGARPGLRGPIRLSAPCHHRPGQDPQPSRGGDAQHRRDAAPPAPRQSDQRRGLGNLRPPARLQAGLAWRRAHPG